MTYRNVLFEDNIKIISIDKDGKVFDKVSRIEARAEDSDCKVLLDINTDIYPVTKDGVYSILITKSLAVDGSPSPNTFSFDIYSKKSSLLDKFDYVVHGKIFKYSEESDGKVSVYVSFGGLLFGLTGEPSHLSNLVMDERVYMLMKKLQ
jgi:DNA-directed RNA polymerase I, II, and III subunit RPABC3